MGEGVISDINGSLGSLQKNFSNFSKPNTKFCLSLHYGRNNSYSFVNGKEIDKCKDYNKNINFPAQFCLEDISNRYSAFDSRKDFLGKFFSFSAD